MTPLRCSLLIENGLPFWLGICPEDDDYESYISNFVEHGCLLCLIPCVKGADRIVSSFESLLRVGTHIVVLDHNIESVEFTRGVDNEPVPFSTAAWESLFSCAWTEITTRRLFSWAISGTANPFFHQQHTAEWSDDSKWYRKKDTLFEVTLDCRGIAGYMFGLRSRCRIGCVDEQTQCSKGGPLDDVERAVRYFSKYGRQLLFLRVLVQKYSSADSGITAQCKRKVRRIRMSQQQMQAILHLLAHTPDSRVEQIIPWLSRCRRSGLAAHLAWAMKRLGKLHRLHRFYKPNRGTK